MHKDTITLKGTSTRNPQGIKISCVLCGCGSFVVWALTKRGGTVVFIGTPRGITGVAAQRRKLGMLHGKIGTLQDH